jgi:hypothetical protein
MKRHVCARGLLVGAISVIALVGGTGVARADSDVFGSPVPGIIDQLLTQTPALFVNPADEGGPSVNWGGTGMYCQNLSVRCSKESITH